MCIHDLSPLINTTASIGPCPRGVLYILYYMVRAMCPYIYIYIYNQLPRSRPFSRFDYIIMSE